MPIELCEYGVLWCLCVADGIAFRFTYKPMRLFVRVRICPGIGTRAYMRVTAVWRKYVDFEIMDLETNKGGRYNNNTPQAAKPDLKRLRHYQVNVALFTHPQTHINHCYPILLTGAYLL